MHPILEQLRALVPQRMDPPFYGFLEAFFSGSSKDPSGIPGVTFLKVSALRVVLRLQGEPPSILKVHRPGSLLQGFRPVLLGNPAKREFLNLAEARRRGQPCPRPLAWGGPPRSGRGFLLLEDLGTGGNLREILSRHPDPLPLLRRTGERIRDLFGAGLQHRDLHLGNLFLDEREDLHFLDLLTLHFRNGSFSPEPRHLKRLYLSLPFPEQRGLRRALFAPLGLPSDPPALPRWRLVHLRKRLARCLRSSGAFRREGPLLFRRGFSVEPSALLSTLERGVVLKMGRRGRVVRIEEGVAKSRRARAALGIWKAAHALELRGLPTPRSLAFLPSERGRAWVLSEALDGAGSLEDSARESLLPRARELGRCFGLLHATGWRFRDPRGDNFLVRGERVYFVDLDGARPLHPRRRPAERASDLGRLYAWLRFQAPAGLRRREGIRAFLRAYLGERAAWNRPERSPRSLVRRAELASERWRKRHP